jgi:hypothetical protein
LVLLMAVQGASVWEMLLGLSMTGKTLSVAECGVVLLS